LGAASAFAVLPFATREAFAEAAGDADLTIQEIEALRLVGTHEVLRGANHQTQTNPAYLYPEHRPAPYKDAPNPKPESAPLTQYYVRIRTRGGLSGLYGAVDREVLPVLLGPLRALLLGQDALALERLWDQMYRSNRHSRASHYMMAIAALDNALWDLRGRRFNAPVFRLLGGPTQQPVGLRVLPGRLQPHPAAARHRKCPGADVTPAHDGRLGQARGDGRVAEQPDPPVAGNADDGDAGHSDTAV
jgi:hypothetical protein